MKDGNSYTYDQQREFGWQITNRYQEWEKERQTTPLDSAAIFKKLEAY